MNDMVKNLILWAVIAVVLMSVFKNFTPQQERPHDLSYSKFIEEVKGGHIKEVTIDDRTIKGITSNDDKFVTYSPPNRLES